MLCGFDLLFRISNKFQICKLIVRFAIIHQIGLQKKKSLLFSLIHSENFYALNNFQWFLTP